MMFSTLRLWNFQIHKRRTIEFDPEVTCLVGASDRGKSAVIRAIHWVCFNQPTGDWQLAHGTDRVRADLTTSEGVVSRRKGKAENTYRIDDGKPYKSFGPGKVPADVERFLKVAEVNFQHQGQGSFWFADSPADVSRQLNAVVDLSVIDETLGNIASMIRQAKAETAVTTKRLESAKAQELALAWVPKMINELDIITEQEDTIARMRQDASRIDSLLLDIQTLQEEVETRETLTQEWESISQGYQEVNTLRGRASSLALLIREIEELQEEVVDLPDPAPIREELEGIEALRDRADRLERLIDDVLEAERCLKDAERFVTSLRAELDAKRGQGCPLCGGPMKNLS